MPQLSFRCLNCNATLKADEARAGQQINCPRCKQLLTIPTPVAAPPPPQPALPAEPPATLPPLPEFDEPEPFEDDDFDELPPAGPIRPAEHNPVAIAAVAARMQSRESVRRAVGILTTWTRIVTYIAGVVATLAVFGWTFLLYQQFGILMAALCFVGLLIFAFAAMCLLWAGSYLIIGAVALLADIHEKLTG